MSEPAATPPGSGPAELAGRLHVYVAFDWGDEIDLARARQQGTAVVLDLSRRARTPASIAYKQPPLRFPLGPLAIEMPGLEGAAVHSAEATVFDFGGVSVCLRVPFRTTGASLRDLAAHLAEPTTAAKVQLAARAAVEPLYHKLLPAITKPTWSDGLWEEYYVFQLPPAEGLEPDALLAEHAGWLAGLLRMEDEPLSTQEVTEALRLVIRYGARDLFVPDWGAAVLVDREAESEETLQAVEFANLQLLEYRHIDDRLDAVLEQADGLLRGAPRRRLPLWGSSERSLRTLGELKVEANGLFERTGNVLKLVGDQYLARVYRLLSTRFHLPEWEKNIGRKLEVLEGVYQVFADQAHGFRSEFLETVVVILILIEIVLALVGKGH